VVSEGGERSAMGGVAREHKMLKGRLPRVIYHQICLYTKTIDSGLALTQSHISPSTPVHEDSEFGNREHPGLGVLDLFDTMYLSISFRKSRPPQNRRLNVLMSNSQQQVDDFVGELTFLN